MSLSGRLSVEPRALRSAALLCVSLMAACGLLDSDDGAKEARLMPGILAFGADTGGVAHPAEARVGEPFTVTVTTFGFCRSDYLMEGPRQTLTTIEGLEADVRPMDLLQPLDCLRGGDCACPDILLKFRHEVSLTSSGVGTMLVRVLGRGLKVGQSNAARGDPIVREVTIDVRPSGS